MEKKVNARFKGEVLRLEEIFSFKGKMGFSYNE